MRPGQEDPGAVARARRDDRLAVRRRLEHRAAEPDALVRERDDVERAVDLAGLGGERQEREVRRRGRFARTSSLIADSSSVSRFVASSARPRSVRKYSGGRTPPPMITKCAGAPSRTRMSAASTSSGQPFWRRTKPAKPIATRSGGSPSALLPAPLRETGGSTRVVHDRQRQPDREALRDVAVDRDRRVAPALHHRARSRASGGRGPRRRAPSAGARRPSRRCGARPSRPRAAASRSGGRPGSGACRISRSSWRRCGGSAATSRPSTSQRRPSYGRVPRVREDRDLARVHGRAGVGEEVGGGPFRAEDVRLEARRRGGGSAARATTARRRAAAGGGRRAPGSARAAARSGGRSPRSAARSSPGRSSPPRARARVRPKRSRRVRLGEQLRDRVGERLDAEVVDEDAGLAGDDDAAAGARARRDDRHAGRRGLDHRPAELGPLRRRDDDVARLVEVRGVLRERDEAEELRQPELVDELLRLGLVVARQVGELQRAADERAEELLAADGAADDQVARVEPAVAQPRGGLDELAEALRRVDEAEVRDDRAVGGQAERRLRARRVARAEARRGRRSSGRPSSRRRRRSRRRG